MPDRQSLEAIRGMVSDTIAGDASWSFGIKIFGAILQFGFSFAIARLLGPYGAGLYFVAISVLAILTTIARVGLDRASLRFIAIDNNRLNWDSIRAIHQTTIIMIVLLGTVISVAIYVSAPWIANSLLSIPEALPLLRIGSLGIVPLSLIAVFAEHIRGLMSFRWSFFVSDIALVLISLILLPTLVSVFGIVGSVMAYVIGALVTLMVAWIIWLHLMSSKPRTTIAHVDVRQLLMTGIPIFWIAVANLSMTKADAFIVSLWLDPVDVGVYSIARRVAGSISFVMLAVNGVTAPRFAVAHKQNDHEKLQKLAQRSSRLMVLGMLPIVVLLVSMPRLILGLFGEGFVRGVLPMLLLSGGQLISAVAGPVGYLLTMTGYEKDARNIVLVSTLLNLLLMIVLVPMFGIIGAAVATVISITVNNGLGLWTVRRKLDIRIWF